MALSRRKQVRADILAWRDRVNQGTLGCSRPNFCEVRYNKVNQAWKEMGRVKLPESFEMRRKNG